jgi:Tol biopolymer transport system component
MAIDGGERVLTKSEYAQIPTGWSPDGQLLALAVESGGTNWDIKIFHEGDDKLYETYSSTPANETGGVISPDGRYLAYQSDQSGNWEVWVNSFSSPFVKWQISARGGICPRWSGDGKELFYVSGDELMSVPLSYEPRIAIGTPRRILEAVFSGYPGFNRFDMVPGGQGFVFLTPAETDKISLPGEMRVVLNWFDELATRVPTRE